MYPNADILEFLFATAATIIATLTGLIGAFSTFRLQNIIAEIQLLKGLLLDKPLPNGKLFKDYVKGEKYYLLEKIYDTDAGSIVVLQQIVANNRLENQLNELIIDIDNIKQNQLRHDNMKLLTVGVFVKSLVFTFISLLLLVFVNGLMQTGQILWIILTAYLTGVVYTFHQFVLQLKKLI